MLDRDRFPLLSAYLNGLPHGLDSYQECRSKASLVSSAVDGHDVTELTEGLPESLRSIVLQPPPGGVWVPAAVSDAVFFAVCDRYYPTEENVLAWTRGRTLAMARNPIYQAILRVPGPRKMLTIATQAHRMFQRGTRLDTTSRDGHADLLMSFPPRLHVGLNLVSNIALIRAVLELTGGKNVRCEMTSANEIEARYTLDWD